MFLDQLRIDVLTLRVLSVNTGHENLAKAMSKHNYEFMLEDAQCLPPVAHCTFTYSVEVFQGAGLQYCTAPHLYNTQSGVPPREAPFRAIDLGEVALRPHLT